MTGHVYFLQVETDGPIKIGFTKNDIWQRVRGIQLLSPHTLRWIGMFAGTRGDERKAHILLQHSSLRGEWFHPTSEVLEFIAEKSPCFTPVIVDNPLFSPHRVKGRPTLYSLNRERLS